MPRRKKRIGNSYIHCQKIQSEYRNGIWHRKMRHDSNEKRQTTPYERNGTTKSRKLERLEKRKLTNTWRYWKLSPSNKRREKKKKIRKNISEEPEATRDKTIKQEHDQRNKYLGSPRKILGTILEVDQRRT